MCAHEQYIYNGILVYSKNDELQELFYKNVCEDRMIVIASNDITKSLTSVKIKFDNKHNAIRPKIFIATQLDDYSFDIEYFRQQRYFEEYNKKFGVKLEAYCIIETPTLTHCLWPDKAERMDNEIRLFNGKKNEDKSRRAFYVEKFAEINLRKILKENPVFSELYKALNQPLKI